MSTLMQRGLNMLARELPRAAGGKIVYQRGTQRVWLDATFGRTEFAVDSSDVVRIEHTDRDFIFPAEGLILGGKLATPERGDLITLVEDDHGASQVFEVLSTDGKQCYRTCDTTGHMIRVYTKRITA